MKDTEGEWIEERGKWENGESWEEWSECELVRTLFMKEESIFIQINKQKENKNFY